MITVDIAYDHRKRAKAIEALTDNAAEATYIRTIYGCTKRYTNDSIVRYAPEPLVIHQFKNRFNANEVQFTDKLIEWGKSWDAYARRSAEIQKLSTTELGINAALEQKLRQYQRVGVRWIAESHNCILADEPGIGKTIQALIADAVTNSERTLILCPTYVINVWETHIVEWLNTEALVAYDKHRATRAELLNLDARYMITNHETLRSYNNFTNRTFDHIIVDEAHRFQGRNSKQTKGLRKLADRASKVTLLTGSPMWNRPDSLWSLLNILYPNRFSSYWKFVDYFCETVRTPWSNKIVGVKPKQAKILQWVLAPLLYQRKKVDVLPELPPKIIQTITYQITDRQRKQYTSLKRHFRMRMADGKNKYLYNGASAIALMRRMINMPEIDDATMSNPKLATIQNLITDSELPVVVFTWHREYAKFLTEQLSANYRVAMLTGEISVEDREVIVEAFQDGNFDVLVANIAAANLGISLHRASTAIFAEGAFPALQVDQAEDRLHRLGQSNTTMIYRLQAANTIEEAVWKANLLYKDNVNTTLPDQYLIDHILENRD